MRDKLLLAFMESQRAYFEMQTRMLDMIAGGELPSAPASLQPEKPVQTEEIPVTEEAPPLTEEEIRQINSQTEEINE